MSLLWVFAISLLASFTQRVSGFGFGIIAMTVFSFALPSYGEATALSGMRPYICRHGHKDAQAGALA